MYYKLRNVLQGLAFAALAIAGGMMVGTPVPGSTQQNASAQATADAALLRGVDQAQAPLVEVQAVPTTGDTRPARTNLGLRMPYFSFRATLPRAPSLPER